MIKRNLNYIAIMAIMGVMVTGCVSGKKVTQQQTQTQTQSSQQQQVSSETQEKIKKMEEEAALLEAQAKLDAVKRKTAAEAAQAVMDLPCFVPDDESWYRGTVARRSPVGRTNTLATACLRAARQNLQQKIKGALKQVTRDYFDQMDVNEKSTEASHIESASDYIVDQFLNDMMEDCRKITQVDDQGMVIMYIGVKISKKALIDDLSNGLSQDEELKVRFNEKVFRDDAFKVFSQDKQNSFDDYKNARE
jgi:cell division protein FtsB